MDGGAPDSFSARLKVRFGGGWSGQASHAFLKDPETLSRGNARRTHAFLRLRWGRPHGAHAEAGGASHVH